jgi:uncharacterized alpha/beta hydrolase family protein
MMMIIIIIIIIVVVIIIIIIIIIINPCKPYLSASATAPHPLEREEMVRHEHCHRNHRCLLDQPAASNKSKRSGPTLWVFE